MNEHKRALLEAWNQAPLWGHECEGSHEVLGGRKVVREVERLLKESIEFAKSEAIAAVERWEGRAWWARYIEEPVEEEMRTTLRLAVPRRRDETETAYTERLIAIEHALRARLMPFIRDPSLAPPGSP